MKKIGCVICYTPNHNNYGTSLQAYAMLKKIQQLGFDVEVINYIKRLTPIEKIKYLWNAFRCGELKKVFRIFLIKKKKKEFPEYAQGLKERTFAVNRYKENKIAPFLKDYIGFQQLEQGSKKYDAVVVGSDQVWTPLSLPNRFFNLLFVDDSVKKIAYASSFGVSEIPRFQWKRTGEYLDRFFVVGVREKRGKEIVDSLSHKTATVVADPTLLLSQNEWIDEINESLVSPSGPYIFCYLISENENARRIAQEFGKKKKMKIIAIRHMEQYRAVDETYGDEAPYNVGPNDFLKYISNATYVITDSFHCSVFSIMFHRNFMTFYRSTEKAVNSRNSRIDSLFSVLGINRNHIFSGNIDDIESPVDWEHVDRQLIELRSESIDFLKNALL